MSSKFYNIDVDNTLGGNSASDTTVSSQKAIKGYVDNGFKPKQTAVTDPTANGEDGDFISDITQDANGVITPHKKHNSKVKHEREVTSNNSHPILFQQKPFVTAQSPSKYDIVVCSEKFNYNPANDVLSVGKIAADGSQLTNLPATTPSSHQHGNIQNGGTLQTNDVTIATGDKLVVTDASDSNKITRTSLSFDTSNTSDFLRKDGTWATPSGGGGDTGYTYSALSDNASTVTFGASKGYFKVNVTGSTQTFNLAIGNTCVNYLLVTNTGSADCTVALGMQSGGTWTSFVLPTDTITVPSGKSIEMSFISINSHTQLVVTKSAELEVTTLS